MVEFLITLFCLGMLIGGAVIYLIIDIKHELESEEKENKDE